MKNCENNKKLFLKSALKDALGKKKLSFGEKTSDVSVCDHLIKN